jgi:hypothetical protein
MSSLKRVNSFLQEWVVIKEGSPSCFCLFPCAHLPLLSAVSLSSMKPSPKLSKCQFHAFGLTHLQNYESK